MKTTLLFLFTCLVFAACSKTKKGYVNGIQYSIIPVDSSKNFVIDGSELYGVIFDKYSQRYGEETKTFTPTPEEVFKAEDMFRRCLENKTVAAGVVMDASKLQDLFNYYRQYVGVRNEQGQKEVQIHFFNKSHQFPNDWRK